MITKHAQIRSKQRGIPREAIDLIVLYGIAEKAPGNSTRRYLNKLAMDQRIHELKQEIQMIERLKRIRCIVSNGTETIITTYREN